MKEFEVVITKTTIEYQTIVVVAKDEDEAGLLLNEFTTKLHKTRDMLPYSSSIRDFNSDNFEIEDETYEWDDLDCVVNCDEDEEEEDAE